MTSKTCTRVSPLEYYTHMRYGLLENTLYSIEMDFLMGSCSVHRYQEHKYPYYCHISKKPFFGGVLVLGLFICVTSNCTVFYMQLY